MRKMHKKKFTSTEIQNVFDDIHYIHVDTDNFEIAFDCIDKNGKQVIIKKKIITYVEESGYFDLN